MKTYKHIKNYLLVVLLTLSFNVGAEQEPYKVIEFDALSIKLSKDGTGIIKNIRCMGCKFNFVKITKNSKATIQGEAVDIMEAKKRAGKPAMVSFTPATQEVQYIRW